MSTTRLEQSKISPSSYAPTEFSLPIIFFDLLWYEFPPIQQAFFFDFPNCSKSHFLKAVVPSLKRSLSQTLNHFLPLAGNIIHPLTPTDKPVLRYVSGDSVSFSVSESRADFSHLSGHHPRDAGEFYAFVPELPSGASIHLGDSIAFPVFAVQATVFPGQGVCIGIASRHVVADASTMASFMQAWALINRSLSHMIMKGGAEEEDAHHNDTIRNLLAEAKLLPFYDRESVANSNIRGLNSIYWDRIVQKDIVFAALEPPNMIRIDGLLRTTFVLRKDEIQRLKDCVLSYRHTESLRLVLNDHDHRHNPPSSLTVACALVWICSANAAAGGGEEVADDEPECFTLMADCRGRLESPSPANYFGNCVALIKAELRHGELKGAEGFATAAESMGKAIRASVHGENGILHGAELWPEEFEKFGGKRVYGVSGSPRFDFYAVDYGWGTANKIEILSIDGGRSISVSKSREFEGGLEIGISKPKLQMEAFTEVFRQVLADLLG